MINKTSWALLLTWAILQGLLFTSGYRLTADDVLAHYSILLGFDSAIELINQFAIASGRVGQFLTMPLVIIGAYFSDFYWVRSIYVGIYFVGFYLFCKYFSLISKSNSLQFFLVIMLAINPLAYNHFPPTAYPLQITIPLIGILLIRIKLIKILSTINSSTSAWLLKTLWLSMFILTLTNEYTFVFTFTLIICELIYFLYERYSIGVRGFYNLILKKPFFKFDAYVLSSSLILYITYRLIHPSVYSGNIPGGVFNFEMMAKTMLGHIYSGTSFSTAMSYSGVVLDAYQLSDLNSITLYSALLVTACSFFLAFQFLLGFRELINPKLNIAVGCIFVFLISLPLASTIQYQEWCREICAHLDSRISFYGVGIIFSTVLLVIVKGMQKFIPKKIVAIIIAFILSILSANTYIENYYVAQDMHLYVSGWERAKRIACSPEFNEMDDSTLVKKIDPNGLISFHPGFPVAKYWRAYIEAWKVEPQLCN